jgi:hypothetical protein
MPVYTVHAPLRDGNDALTADRAVLVRDGFHVWAALAGGVWLIAHRLWIALVGYLVAIFALIIALKFLRLDPASTFAVLCVIAVLMGLEAASLQRWTLSRGKWRQLDVVVAEDRDAAERRFFDRWVSKRAAANIDMPTDRGAPPPLRPGTAQAESHDVMGLFPQPGAPR